MRRRLLAAILPLLLLAPGELRSEPGSPPLPAEAPDAPPASPADPLEPNKALVRRYIAEVLSANRLDRLDEMVSPHFRDATPGAEGSEVGPALVRAAQQRVRATFPVVSYRIDDLVAEGDRVVARYTVTAATREENGQAQEVEITGISIFRIADGKLREVWIVNDQVELYRQLGFTLQPPE